MGKIRVLGIFIHDRKKEAGEVQRLLTGFGCIIKTRLGLHDAFDDDCSDRGLILLELAGNESLWGDLEEKLSKIEGIKVQRMDFEY
ncbi:MULTISPECIES: hypothetical protein [unclassified Marinitoga]|uniref:hypothetical protein n=1 Tax=unclassified Marinitoga TaxID=2640159 RepID=UPI00064178E1|nr:MULTISPECIES: hypothetical protein [unclassified Marinitoga]KLO22307.1 hypothetical protein X274_08295 [Marinitoga sp. 1155]NUU99555.1 hypothetical protein [Marinitoga sp. 1154]